MDDTTNTFSWVLGPLQNIPVSKSCDFRQSIKSGEYGFKEWVRPTTEQNSWSAIEGSSRFRLFKTAGDSGQRFSAELQFDMDSFRVCVTVLDRHSRIHEHSVRYVRDIELDSGPANFDTQLDAARFQFNQFLAIFDGINR